jgi:hypothetical protein
VAQVASVLLEASRAREIGCATRFHRCGFRPKADTIAHRTARTITEKMDEDPVFYRRFGKILQETIDAYRQQRIKKKNI